MFLLLCCALQSNDYILVINNTNIAKVSNEDNLCSYFGLFISLIILHFLVVYKIITMNLYNIIIYIQYILILYNICINRVD